MKYFVTGEFNKGLYVHSNNKLILYSKRHYKFFDKVDIEIFDANNHKIIEFKNGITNLKFRVDRYFDKNSKVIEIQGRKGISFQGFIRVEDLGCVKLKYNIVGFLSPYIRLTIDKKCIGTVKRRLFSFKKKYCLNIEDTYDQYAYYVLIYLLIFETEFDHD